MNAMALFSRYGVSFRRPPSGPTSSLPSRDPAITIVVRRIANGNIDRPTGNPKRIIVLSFVKRLNFILILGAPKLPDAPETSSSGLMRRNET
jgi:hypothetical protein